MGRQFWGMSMRFRVWECREFGIGERVGESCEVLGSVRSEKEKRKWTRVSREKSCGDDGMGLSF